MAQTGWPAGPQKAGVLLGEGHSVSAGSVLSKEVTETTCEQCCSANGRANNGQSIFKVGDGLTRT